MDEYDWLEYQRELMRLAGEKIGDTTPLKWHKVENMDELKDRLIRSQMEHELADIMFDVRNGRGHDDPTD